MSIKYSNVTKEKISDLYNSGKSYREIAEILGCTRGYISNRLSTWGLTNRRKINQSNMNESSQETTDDTDSQTDLCGYIEIGPHYRNRICTIDFDIINERFNLGEHNEICIDFKKALKLFDDEISYDDKIIINNFNKINLQGDLMLVFFNNNQQLNFNATASLLAGQHINGKAYLFLRAENKGFVLKFDTCCIIYYYLEIFARNFIRIYGNNSTLAETSLMNEFVQKSLNNNLTSSNYLKDNNSN